MKLLLMAAAACGATALTPSATFSRRAWLGTLATATVAAPAAGDAAAAAAAGGSGIARIVIRTSSLQESVAFWSALGMKVVRPAQEGRAAAPATEDGAEDAVPAAAARNALLAFDDAAVAVELERVTGRRSLGTGGAVSYLEIASPVDERMTSYRLTEAKAEIIPHWALEKPYVEARSPDNVVVRVSKRAGPPKLAAVALAVDDVSKSQSFYESAGLKTRSGGILESIASLTPLSDGSARVGLAGDPVDFLLVPQPVGEQRPPVTAAGALLFRGVPEGVDPEGRVLGRVAGDV